MTFYRSVSPAEIESATCACLPIENFQPYLKNRHTWQMCRRAGAALSAELRGSKIFCRSLFSPFRFFFLFYSCYNQVWPFQPCLENFPCNQLHLVHGRAHHMSTSARISVGFPHGQLVEQRHYRVFLFLLTILFHSYFDFILFCLTLLLQR